MIQNFLSPRFLLVLAVGLVLALAPLTPVQAQATQPDPTNVKVFAGDGYLALRWTAPTGWASTAARGFEVDLATGATVPSHQSAAWKRVGDRPENATRSLLTGTVAGVTVTNGTQYHLRLRAKSGTPPDHIPSNYVTVSGTPSQFSFTVKPSEVSVFKTGRAAYTLRLNRRPSANVEVTPSSSDSSKVVYNGQPLVFTPDDWWGDKTVIITGVDTGAARITHAVDSTDDKFVTSGAELVDVTVEDTPMKPTITILNQEFNYREGSTAPGEENQLFLEGNINRLALTKVDVQLDITPAPGGNGHVIWHISHPSASNTLRGPGGACFEGRCDRGTAAYHTDYVVEGLGDRRVWYTANSHDMRFSFELRADNDEEPNETVVIWITPKSWQNDNLGIFQNDAVCIGSCDSLPDANDQHLTITILDDDESSGADPCPNCAIGSASGEGILPDDPVGTYTISSSVRAVEGQNALPTLALSRLAPDAGVWFQLTPEYITASPKDVGEFSTWVKVPGGARRLEVPILMVDDAYDEDDESFVLVASPGSPGWSRAYAKAGRTGVTIEDNDSAGITVTAASPITVNEGATASYTAVLNSQPLWDVAIKAVSADPSKAFVFPASQTITPDSWNVPVTFTAIALTDDDSDDESVGVSHSATSQDAQYENVQVSPVSIVVTDTTPPQEQDSSGDKYADLIKRIKEWRNDPDWVDDKTHTDRWDRVLLALGEEVSDETLTPMTAAEAQELADRGWQRWVEVAKALKEVEAGGQQDPPPTEVSVSVAGGAATVDEDAGDVKVTATLDAPAPSGGISLALDTSSDSTAGSADFTLKDSSIDIPAGQTSASGTLAITDDPVDEDNETVIVGVFAISGGIPLAATATVTIVDDDTAGVTVSPTSLSISEDGSGTYTVVLDSEPTAEVTVTPGSGDGGAASVSPASHIFTASNWDVAATFTVSGVADDDTNDESVGVSHQVSSQDAKYALALLPSVSVAVSDSTPPNNNAPTVSSAIADATIVNESGTKQVSLSGVFRDADNDALTITAASSDAAKATVSVAADHSSLTVSAQARGTATVTVTASDGNGGTVEDTFTITVKAAPVVASAIADATMTVETLLDVSLKEVFKDADGDALTVTAASSNGSVAEAILFQGTLTVLSVKEGSVTITVTAEDSDGNTVSDAFDVSVTPTNNAPTVSSAIADATIVNESGTKQVSLSGVFSDADNDALTITAASSDAARATVSVSADYSSLTVTAKARGTATITVTASDGNGGTVSDSFTVTVKASPVVASAIADVSGLEAGNSRDVSLSGVFKDADGDALTVTAVSSDTAKATVSVAADGSKLTVTGVAEGSAAITVTAQDADGNRVSDAFDVVVDKKYAALIKRMYQWRNDPQWVDNKDHTDRWDRVLLAFGETVEDTSLTPMSASEAQESADRGWSRWVEVAKALREIESG